jgi:NAD(P)H-hydrate epimerase
VSVDIPSGIDVDSGEVFEPSINADYTVQMGFSKISSLFYPAKTKYGQIVFQELKYPVDLISRSSSVRIFSVDLSMVKSFIPERKITGSKFDHGLGMLLAGSYGMSGSAMLSGSAAMRSGLGLLHVFSYEAVLPIIATNLWDAVLHPITENAKTNIDYIKDFLTSRKIDALALGPGLSTTAKSISLVKNILELMTMIDSKPLILDADAINAFVGSADLLKVYSGELLITPHAKEFSRLFQEDISEYAPYDKAKFLSETAKKYSLNILYKGAPTYIARSSGEVYIVPTGCSALAKAGSGDVLTGLILSFVAQGLELYQAAILAAYVHNLMGLLAVEKDSEYSVLASDLIKYVGMAIEILKQDNIKNCLIQADKTTQNKYGPLFNMTMAASMWITGQNWTLLKLPSILADSLICVIIYLITLRFTSKETAFNVSLIYSFSFMALLLSGLWGNDDPLFMDFYML